MSAGGQVARTKSSHDSGGESAESIPGLWVTWLLAGGRDEQIAPLPLRAALGGLHRLGFDVDPDAEIRRSIEAGCERSAFSCSLRLPHDGNVLLVTCHESIMCGSECETALSRVQSVSDST